MFHFLIIINDLFCFFLFSPFCVFYVIVYVNSVSSLRHYINNIFYKNKNNSNNNKTKTKPTMKPEMGLRNPIWRRVNRKYTYLSL